MKPLKRKTKVIFAIVAFSVVICIMLPVFQYSRSTQRPPIHYFRMDGLPTVSGGELILFEYPKTTTTGKALRLKCDYVEGATEECITHGGWEAE